MLAEGVERKFGVYVGRFSPVHLGHQPLLEMLLQTFRDKHLVCIGSCSHQISFRHLFTYPDRFAFIRALFPDIRLVGLPDFDSEPDWFHQLADTLALCGVTLSEATFIGGCHEDISFFVDRGYRVKILNRFSGETPRISATEVRDALIERRSIEGLVDPRIIPMVTERFQERYALLRKK